MSLIKMANYEEAEGTKAGSYNDFGAGARAMATEARRFGTVSSGSDCCKPERMTVVSRTCHRWKGCELPNGAVCVCDIARRRGLDMMSTMP